MPALGLNFLNRWRNFQHYLKEISTSSPIYPESVWVGDLGTCVFPENTIFPLISCSNSRPVELSYCSMAYNSAVRSEVNMSSSFRSSLSFLLSSEVKRGVIHWISPPQLLKLSSPWKHFYQGFPINNTTTQATVMKSARPGDHWEGVSKEPGKAEAINHLYCMHPIQK